MTLIEGVGDEVIQFLAVVLLIVVAALAWWSTNARPDRYRTVLVMRSRAHHPVTVSIRTRPAQPAGISNLVTNSSTDDISENARVIPLQEMDSIVDADMAMLNNNRLHFYRRIDSPSNSQADSEPSTEEVESQEEPEQASNAQIREMDSIVSAMEADVTDGCDFFTRNDSNPSEAHSDKKIPKKNSEEEKVNKPEEIVQAENASTDVMASNENGDQNDSQTKILIKLKYLNDTLKEVEGKLDEPLKDFKWRHFPSELAAECRVRLIFNGRVLVDDAATLRALGLHHRAVVHCLVHPKRAPPPDGRQQPALEPAGTPELVSEGAAPERSWDLENLLMTFVSVALTVVWFFRCEYSNMFTASASVALLGLTVFYSVSIFGLYLTDTFHFDRRPVPQPVPAQ